MRGMMFGPSPVLSRGSLSDRLPGLAVTSCTFGWHLPARGGRGRRYDANIFFNLYWTSSSSLTARFGWLAIQLSITHRSRHNMLARWSGVSPQSGKGRQHSPLAASLGVCSNELRLYEVDAGFQFFSPPTSSLEKTMGISRGDAQHSSKAWLYHHKHNPESIAKSLKEVGNIIIVVMLPSVCSPFYHCTDNPAGRKSSHYPQ